MTVRKDIKFLVVDDFPSMRRIITNLLRSLGYKNVITADDGAIALEIMRSEQIDFVITDWNMPNISGLELVKTIRSDEELKLTPILMVTAESLQQNIVTAIKAGVNNYIVKPFDQESMRTKVNWILERATHLHE